MLDLKLFDVHTHTQFAAYAEDQDAVIQRALDAGVWMINVGTQKDTSAGAVQTAHRFPEGVFAAVGLHPIHTEVSYHDVQELGGEKGFTSHGEKFDYQYYKILAEDKKVVAIGECGLDYYRMMNKESRVIDEDVKRLQTDIFRQQVMLAREVEKPLMIHCRNAYDDMIQILRQEKAEEIGGNIHFFAGSWNTARQFLDLGFYLSFTGVFTFTHDYDEVVEKAPLERIMVETDAPYVTPVPYRGKRNEPLYVEYTARRIAEIKKLPEEQIFRQLVENTRKLFKI